jgi:hypothetical protein
MCDRAAWVSPLTPARSRRLSSATYCAPSDAQKAAGLLGPPIVLTQEVSSDGQLSAGPERTTGRDSKETREPERHLDS